MSRTVGILLSVLLVLVAIFGVEYYYKYGQQAKQPTQTQAPVSQVSPTLAPPKLDVVMGTITALSGGVMMIQTASGSIIFNISTLSNVQRLISGEFGSGKVATASASDLKVGQEIHVIGSGGNATEVIIVK